MALSYTLIGLFFAGCALANLATGLHSPRGNSPIALAFFVLVGPVLLFSARSTVVRQAPQLVSRLESVLAAVTSAAL